MAVLQTHRLNGKLNDLLTGLGAIWRCVCQYPVCKFKNDKRAFPYRKSRPKTTELILTVSDCFLKSLQREKFLIQWNKSEFRVHRGSHVCPSISQTFIVHMYMKINIYRQEFLILSHHVPFGDVSPQKPSAVLNRGFWFSVLLSASKSVLAPSDGQTSSHPNWTNMSSSSSGSGSGMLQQRLQRRRQQQVTRCVKVESNFSSRRAQRICAAAHPAAQSRIPNLSSADLPSRLPEATALIYTAANTH